MRDGAMRRLFGVQGGSDASGPGGVLLIRLPVGLIFLSQGILKFTDAKMGLVRFAHIGFPHPGFTAHFVGGVEIVCGLLVVLGLATRLAALPLLAVISTAIVTTKLPELFRPGQGFWFMVSDARTDSAMLCCLLFLVGSGAGRWSLDAARQGNARPYAPGTPSFSDHGPRTTDHDSSAP